MNSDNINIIEKHNNDNPFNSQKDLDINFGIS